MKSNETQKPRKHTMEIEVTINNMGGTFPRFTSNVANFGWYRAV